jgi:hypothetical protein
MSSLWNAVFIQVLDRTGALTLNLSGTPYTWYPPQSRSFSASDRILKPQNDLHLVVLLIPNCDD